MRSAGACCDLARPPPQQGGQLVGAARGGDADGEPVQGPDLRPRRPVRSPAGTPVRAPARALPRPLLPVLPAFVPVLPAGRRRLRSAHALRPESVVRWSEPVNGG